MASPWRVSGLSVDAPTLFEMARVGNADAILNLVFGGSDIFNGSEGNDWVDGYDGNDNISTGGGADFVRGLDGNDIIDGGLGDDDVNGNRGEDDRPRRRRRGLVRGGQGDDFVSGDAGDDGTSTATSARTRSFGGDAGNDIVFGGQDHDQLFGDDGADSLSGDLGNDTMTGGEGADRFAVPGGRRAPTWSLDFDPGQGDRVQLTTGTAFTWTSVGGSAVLDLGGGETLTLSGVGQGSNDWVVFA